MPVKLKESCSACATSKLRCSKDQPTCSRCARKGIQCVYLPSNRAGRNHSRRPITQASIDVGLSQQQPRPLQPAHSSHTPPTDWDWLMASPLSSSSAALSAIDPCSMPPPPSTPRQLANDHDNYDEFYFQPQSQCFTTSGSLPPCMDANQTDLGAMSGVCTTPPSPSDHSDSCLRVVIQILQHVSSRDAASCTATSWQLDQDPAQGAARSTSPAAIGDVVKDNKYIIEKLGTMLDCSCLLQEFVVNLLPPVVLKIVDSYSAAAARKSLGGHSQRVAACHILGELHGVHRLVNRICTQMHTVRSQSGHVSVLSSETVKRFEIDMRTHIQVASGEIIDMLRCGPLCTDDITNFGVL